MICKEDFSFAIISILVGESILAGSGAFIVRVKDIFHLLTALGGQKVLKNANPYFGPTDL